MSNFIINFSRIILLVILCVTSDISLAMDETFSDTASSSRGSLKRRRSGDSSDEEGTIDSSTTVESTVSRLSDDPRFKSLSDHPGFTFTPAPKAAPARKKGIGIDSYFGKENQSRVNGSIAFEGAWYQKAETGNWVLNLGNGTNATIIPGTPAELLFGSDAHTKGAVYMFATTEQAKKIAENMATAKNFPFCKRKILPAKKNLFVKRK